jgi:large subunit ribosomal protein L29
MDYKELRQKSAPELQRLLAAWREQLRDKRFRISQGQHKDVREIRELKRDIARVLTHLRQLANQP